MGHGISIKCSNCHRSKKFLLGVGWDYDSLERVVSFLPPGKQPAVQEIIQNHSVDNTEYSRELFHCIYWNRLYDRLYMKIYYDGKEEYETEYFCKKCEAKLEKIDESQVTEIPCSNCGRKTLVVREDLLWD